MDIQQKTFMMLMDDYITTTIKIYMGQEILNKPNATDKELADTFKNIQSLNRRRNQLMRILDDLFHGTNEYSPTEKSYK